MTAKNNFDLSGWFQDPDLNHAPSGGKNQRAWRLVLLGGPGVGKGTQGELLCLRFGICHLSTGDLFRAAGKQEECDQSAAVAEAMRCMRRGELVPDATAWQMVRERGDSLRRKSGFLLDGFPRTLPQAEELNRFLEDEKRPLSAVIDYEMPSSEIIVRLSGRRICENCRAVFHVAWRPPKAEGVCDACGGRLCQREDDHAASIAVRLEVYKHSTAPLIAFYKNLGLLTPVDAVGTSEEVHARTMAALQA